MILLLFIMDTRHIEKLISKILCLKPNLVSTIRNNKNIYQYPSRYLHIFMNAYCAQKAHQFSRGVYWIILSTPDLDFEKSHTGCNIKAKIEPETIQQYIHQPQTIQKSNYQPQIWGDMGYSIRLCNSGILVTLTETYKWFRSRQYSYWRSQHQETDQLL